MTYQEALRQQLMSKTAKCRGAFGVANPPAKFEKNAENNLDLHKRGSGNIRAIIEAVKRHFRNSGIGKTAASRYGRLYDKCPTT